MSRIVSFESINGPSFNGKENRINRILLDGSGWMKPSESTLNFTIDKSCICKDNGTFWSYIDSFMIYSNGKQLDRIDNVCYLGEIIEPILKDNKLYFSAPLIGLFGSENLIPLFFDDIEIQILWKDKRFDYVISDVEYRCNIVDEDTPIPHEGYKIQYESWGSQEFTADNKSIMKVRICEKFRNLKMIKGVHEGDVSRVEHFSVKIGNDFYTNDNDDTATEIVLDNINTLTFNLGTIAYVTGSLLEGKWYWYSLYSEEMVFKIPTELTWK